MTLVKTLRQSASYLRPHAAGVTFLVATSIIGAILAGVGDPVVTKILIDALGSHNMRRFLTVAVIALFLYTILRLANVVSERLTQRVQNQLSHGLVLKMLKVFYCLSYSAIRQTETCYFVSRIYDEPVGITQMVPLIVQLASSIVLVVSAVGVCIWLSWKVAIVVSVFVPLLRFAAIRYNAKISDTTVKGNEQESRLREGLGRAVDGYKTVNIFGLEQIVRGKINDLMNSYFSVLETRVRYSSAFRALSGMLLSYAELAVLLGAGVEVLRGSLSIGGLFGFVSAYGRAVNGFQNITALIPAISSLGGQLHRIGEFVASPSPQTVRTREDAVMQLEGGVFSVGGRNVLADCDFSIGMGEKVLVQGPNGSGKSTLAHILSGFLEVQKGSRRGPDLTRISALLTPSAFIPGTLRDNVNYTLLPSEKQARFEHLAAQFGLATKLAEDPARFSDGEKRKAQVIMTLLKDADFYIFDEPLANIDIETRDQVMRTILHDTSGKGVVVITHGEDHHRDLFDRQFKLNRESECGEAVFT